ncbi:MAG: pilus assembly protein [Pseudomonas sp.]|nr:pilus assembly protein [Pseudomonas sp.]
MKASLPRKQKGAAAIEFAVVFIIFFAVFYGVVSYSLPLLMLQSFNQASAEAVRNSVSLDPASFATTALYQQQVMTNAQASVVKQLSWLPQALNFSAANVAVKMPGNLLTVTINYPATSINNVIPFLNLPGIGTVPSLPANLSAQSSLQL